MEKIIEKMSSYHIFNNLVPGYLFLIISGQIIEANLIIDNIVYSFFEAYFIGIIISRVSSLLVEKAIYKIWKVNKAPYYDYIKANNKDTKIEILNQDRNMYRSLCTLMIIELFIKIAVVLNISSIINLDIIIILIFIALAILFAFSFIKQSKYISSRVTAICNNKK